MELNLEPGGEGKFAGGRGIVMDYRIRGDNGFLTVAYTRSKFPPWALDGGNEGSPNYVRVLGKDGSDQRFAFVSGLTTHTDDVIRVVTGNGGGIGDPRERDRAAIEDDIRNGLITRERADEVYGAAEKASFSVPRSSKEREGNEPQEQKPMTSEKPLKIMFLNPLALGELRSDLRRHGARA